MGPVENGVAFPVSRCGDVIGGVEDFELVWCQQFFYLGLAPDIILAFLAF